jgi:hypothetical protein
MKVLQVCGLYDSFGGSLSSSFERSIPDGVESKAWKIGLKCKVPS